MKNALKTLPERGALAQCLSGRYGSLALSRAAGEAAAAERRGDVGRSALMRSVIADLRQTIAVQNP